MMTAAPRRGMCLLIPPVAGSTEAGLPSLPLPWGSRGVGGTLRHPRDPRPPPLSPPEGVAWGGGGALGVSHAPRGPTSKAKYCSNFPHSLLSPLLSAVC